MSKGRLLGCVVAVLVAVSLAACGVAPSPSAGPSASATSMGLSSASPSPSTSPPATASGGLVWRSVPMSQFGGVELAAIAALPDGFLAIGAPWGGSPPLTQSPGRPSLWRSRDGLAWQRLPDSPAFIEPRDGWSHSIASVAQGPSGLLVAVGSADLADGSAFDAAAWTSTDGGVSWRRASVDAARDAAMNDVTATSDGFVAVGIDGHPSGGTQMEGSRGAAVWTSPDGSRWSRLPTGPVFAGAQMTRVVRGGSTLVATGVDMPTGAAYVYLPIWTSGDGREWTRLGSAVVPPQHFPAPGSWEVDGVVWTGSQFVAIGAEELGARRVVWTSAAGEGLVSLEPALGPSSPAVAVADVAALGATLVMVGWADASAGGQIALVWESTDGASWGAIPSLPLFENARPMRA